MANLCAAGRWQHAHSAVRSRRAVDTSRQQTLSAIHADLDAGAATGLNLGCVYVEETLLGDSNAAHPTWSHGRLVRRMLSGIASAELARHGYPAFGRCPNRLTTMARGRHAMATGQLITKTRAIELVEAPPWLIAQLRARRRGEPVRSPRLRTARVAWRDARCTTAAAQRWMPPSH